jgi:hypothetical protein
MTSAANEDPRTTPATGILTGIGLLLRRSRGVAHCRRGMSGAYSVIISAVRFARSLQRTSGLVDDAALPSKCDPATWREMALAEERYQRRQARKQQRQK